MICFVFGQPLKVLCFPPSLESNNDCKEGDFSPFGITTLLVQVENHPFILFIGILEECFLPILGFCPLPFVTTNQVPTCFLLGLPL